MGVVSWYEAQFVLHSQILFYTSPDQLVYRFAEFEEPLLSEARTCTIDRIVSYRK